MSEEFVRLPSDNTNVGKLIRAFPRDVDDDGTGTPNTVYEHVFQVQDPVDDRQARVLEDEPAPGAAAIAVRPVGGDGDVKELLLAILLELKQLNLNLCTKGD